MPATRSPSPRLLIWGSAGAGVVLAAIVAIVVVVTVTGRGGTPRAIGLKDVPLVPGTRVQTVARSCDRGVHPYCSLQVVIVGERYQTSQALRDAYRAKLLKLGWTTAEGPDGDETAADSPGHELRLTYATAYEDLLGVDSNWIQRTATISHALSAAMFGRAPTLSIMLLRGSS
jgi:hypothetical protein